MKAVRKFVALVSVALLPIVAAAASPLEEAYLESCRKDPGVPVPISVVSPTVGSEHEGGYVQLDAVSSCFVVQPTKKERSFAQLVSRVSGSTRVSAVTVMKFVSPTHRGRACI